MKMTKFKISALAFALCAFYGCKEENAPKEIKTLGTEVSDVEQNAAQPANENAPSILKGKVRRVVGECDARSVKKDWSPVRMGQKVVEDDRIRTARESEVLVGMNDGSSLLVAENSEVAISAEMIDSLARRVSILVKNGNVYFDVQKQGRSEMEFRTGTATAAIRGTAGFVGSVNGNMVASLKEGKVEVTSESDRTEIIKNQTVILDGRGKAKKLKLKSSGTRALAAAIDSVSKSSGSVEQLTAALEKFDNVYGVRQATFAKKLESKQIRFQKLELPETTDVPSVTLVASATPGLVVSVLGEVDTVGANGLYQRTFEWNPDAYGVKRFIAECRDGDLEIPCEVWSIVYVKPAPPEAAPAEPAVDSSKNLSAVESPEIQKNKNAGPEKSQKNLKLKVEVAKGVVEKIHSNVAYNGNLAFSLKGVSEDDLDELKSIQVRRGGKLVKAFDENDLTSMDYEVPVAIESNHIAEYEVVVAAKNGKKFRAKKTYEVYCLKSNHAGGNMRNSRFPLDKEYEMVKDQLVKD